MKTQKIQAQFLNGNEIARTTKLVGYYSHAFRVTYHDGEKSRTVTGFSGTERLAIEAADAWVSRLTKRPHGYRGPFTPCAIESVEIAPVTAL